MWIKKEILKLAFDLEIGMTEINFLMNENLSSSNKILKVSQ